MRWDGIVNNYSGYFPLGTEAKGNNCFSVKP